MPPTFINAYNSDYTTTGSTKSITVTTQPGDTLVVYGGGDTNGAIALTLATPTGNGVALTLLNSLVANSKSSAYIWSGVDATGGTNWTLSCTVSSSVPVWGFTCVVFRNAGGIGASSGVISSGVPSLGLTTVGNGSMVVVFNNDYGSIDGTSRTMGGTISAPLLPGVYTAMYGYKTDTGQMVTVTRTIIYLPPWTFIIPLGLVIAGIAILKRRKITFKNRT